LVHLDGPERDAGDNRACVTVAERPLRAAPPPHLAAGKQLAFALLTLLLVLFAIEGAVRAYHAVRNVGSDADPRGYVVPDAETGYSLKPGYHEGGIRIDSLGFRGPEVSPAKAPGVYRIVALGDSATFGPHEVECAYPYLLPDLLAPRQTEVVNAGVEGYRSDRALAHLQRDVMPLHPDLVTVFIGWNDLYQNDPNVESDPQSLEGSPLARLLTLSDAAQTFRRVFFLRLQGQRAQTSGGSTLPPDYQPLGYGERLRSIFRTARAGGAEVVVFTWPTILSADMPPAAIAKAHYPPYTTSLDVLRTLYDRYQAMLRQVAAEEQVRVIDNAAIFPDGRKADLFIDTAHFTCEGQAMVAQNVAAALRGTVR
jgi:lysophospholipase L1-like esterase